MFYMLKTFTFCSISHQQAIMIMTSLKDSYDLGDLAVLKGFIRVELDAQKHFNFPSTGNRTSGMNMGQIIAIAQGIRNITQQEIDDQSSEEDSDDDDNKGPMSMAESNRRAE